MFRLAIIEDLDQIMAIVKETIEDLNKEGNFQWGDGYPNINVFKEDIKNHSLYVYLNNSEVVAFICLNHKEDLAYKEVTWNKQEKAFVIHRFAVKRAFQRQKIGSKVIHWVEEYAKRNQIYYLKVDTNSKNIRMNALFKKMGFQYVGSIQLRNVKTVFNCYDKIIEGDQYETR